MTYTRHHIFYYVALLLILSFGLFVAVESSYNHTLQIVVIITTALFYVIGGIVHHHLHHNLNSKIVIEYVLMGALGISIVFFLLRGSL